MKVAAVASISFFDNEIQQKIVIVDDSSTWKDAFAKSIEEGLYGSDYDSNQLEWIMGLPDSLEEARIEVGNGEMDISVEFMSLTTAELGQSDN